MPPRATTLRRTLRHPTSQPNKARALEVEILPPIEEAGTKWPAFPFAKVRKGCLRHDDRPKEVRFDLCAEIRQRRVLDGQDFAVSCIVDNNIQRAKRIDCRLLPRRLPLTRRSHLARRASPGHRSAPKGHSVTQCPELSPRPYCPLQGPLRQSRDPDRGELPVTNRTLRHSSSYLKVAHWDIPTNRFVFTLYHNPPNRCSPFRGVSLRLPFASEYAALSQEIAPASYCPVELASATRWRGRIQFAQRLLERLCELEEEPRQSFDWNGLVSCGFADCQRSSRFHPYPNGRGSGIYFSKSESIVFAVHRLRKPNNRLFEWSRNHSLSRTKQRTLIGCSSASGHRSLWDPKTVRKMVEGTLSYRR